MCHVMRISSEILDKQYCEDQGTSPARAATVELQKKKKKNDR